jgi:putative inorganic carbon (HCO3(-)) transporter
MFGTGLGAFFPLILYFGSIVACAVSLSRPIIGIYVLALILPLQGGRMHLINYPLGSRVLELLLVSVLIGVILKRGSILPPKRLRPVVIALCVITYVSLWIGPLLLSDVPWPVYTSTADGLHTPFGYWINFMHMPVLFALVYSTVKDKRQMQILLLVMMVAFLWNVKNFYGNVGHRETTEYKEALRNSMGQDFGGSNGRAAFATQCTLFLIALFGSIKSLRVRAIIVFLICAGVYSVLFSYSRGAYAAFVLGLLYLGIFRIRWLLLVILVLLPFVTTVLPNSVIQRITMTYNEGEMDVSSADRISIWEHAFQTFRSEPVLGVGFDTYRYFRAGQELLDTHNMYVKALVETGILGFICLVWLFGGAFLTAHQLARSALDPFYRALGTGFSAYMIAVIVTNIFGDRWTYVDLSSYTWILLALVIQARLWTQAATDIPPNGAKLASKPLPQPVVAPAR